MLKIDRVCAGYEGVRALFDVAVEEKKGEIVALIGGNGAGKTTLLNVISGIVRPSAGRIFFQGDDITLLPPEKIVDMGIVQVPEGRLLFDPLTVKENLELGAYRRRLKAEKKKIADDYDYIFDLFPILRKRLEQKAGTLSGGEQQMLAIGRGLMGKPKLMLLDEPSLGLAPILVQDILFVIKRLKKDGTTILLVEQNARAALSISDRAYVLETGHIRIQGPAGEILENKEVKKAYLGQD